VLLQSLVAPHQHGHGTGIDEVAAREIYEDVEALLRCPLDRCLQTMAHCEIKLSLDLDLTTTGPDVFLREREGGGARLATLRIPQTGH
jgi:hypothetical protein